MLDEKMELTCSLCDCLLPLSYDNDKTEYNLELHFNGNRHLNNLGSYYRSTSFDIDCNLCNVYVQISRFSNDVSPLIDHLNGQMHSDNIEEFKNFQPESETAESENDNYSSYSGNNYSGEESYCDEAESYYDEEESNYDEESYEYSSNQYVSDEDDDDDNDDDASYEYRKPFFYCNLCQCEVLMTVNSNDATLQQISTHINGYQHQENLNDKNNENSNGFDCNLCQCYLQMSYDTNASMRNIKTHIIGHRHCQMLPPLDDYDDGAFSSPIYQPD